MYISTAKNNYTCGPAKQAVTEQQGWDGTVNIVAVDVVWRVTQHNTVYHSVVLL